MKLQPTMRPAAKTRHHSKELKLQHVIHAVNQARLLFKSIKHSTLVISDQSASSIPAQRRRVLYFSEWNITHAADLRDYVTKRILQHTTEDRNQDSINNLHHRLGRIKWEPPRRTAADQAQDDLERMLGI